MHHDKIAYETWGATIGVLIHEMDDIQKPMPDGEIIIEPKR